MYLQYKKNPWMIILFSILTCGIYFFVWVYATTKALNDILGEDTPDPAIAVVLSLFTCGIYQIYWYYVIAKKLSAANQKTGNTITTDNSIIFVLLAIFGLGIVNIFIAQADLNNICNQLTTGEAGQPEYY